MFHFPTFPPHALCVQARVTPHDWCGVPPFGNPRINARLTAPRGLSQPPTSFIGSWCQGIHRVPLTTWPHKNPPTHARKDIGERALPTQTPITESEDARVHCAVLNVRPATPHPPPPDPRTPTGDTAVREQESPDTKQRSHPGSPGRPAPSGPNSVPTTGTPRTGLRSTHTPEGMRSTGSPPREPAELVSVPPSSTTPETRGHPRLDDRHV